MNEDLINALLEKLGDPESREYKTLMAMPNNPAHPQTLADIGLGHIGSADKGCWLLIKGGGVTSKSNSQKVVACYYHKPSLGDISRDTGLNSEASGAILLGQSVCCPDRNYQLRFKKFNRQSDDIYAHGRDILRTLLSVAITTDHMSMWSIFLNIANALQGSSRDHLQRITFSMLKDWSKTEDDATLEKIIVVLVSENILSPYFIFMDEDSDCEIEVTMSDGLQAFQDNIFIHPITGLEVENFQKLLVTVYRKGF